VKCIVISRRSDDYMAVEPDTKAWGCGPDPRAAIGDLVSAHWEKFDVEVIWPEAPNAT
jgi:hypothetical protein